MKKKIFSKKCKYEFDMWQAASGKYIMMMTYCFKIKKIFSKCKFGMRQVAGGKRQVYYDDRTETPKEITLNL